MNNQQSTDKTYIHSFGSTSSEPKIKQELTPISNLMPMNNCQIMPTTINQQLNKQLNQQLSLSRRNDSIEYIPNELDDNIQGNSFAVLKYAKYK